MKSFYCLCLIVILTVFSSPAFAQRGRGRRGRRAPLGPRIEPKDLTFDYGLAEIPDRETYESISYQGTEVGIDRYLGGLEFVKFIIDKFDPENPTVYFMNTKNYRAHPPYMRMIGVRSRERGAITYLPRLTNPSGGAGLYIIDYEPNDSYTFQQPAAFGSAMTCKQPLRER